MAAQHLKSVHLRRKPDAAPTHGVNERHRDAPLLWALDYRTELLRFWRFDHWQRCSGGELHYRIFGDSNELRVGLHRDDERVALR